jgi:uncharacterized protein with HEPN domain
MTHRDDNARLRHMLDYARKGVRLASGKTRADLDGDEVFGLAITRVVEVIGEAAARVSDAARNSHPQIPWLAIAGMRNRIIHGYDAVDFDVVWEVIESDLPVLIAQLENIVA